MRVLVSGSVAALALEVVSGRVRKWSKIEVGVYFALLFKVLSFSHATFCV